jgi:uncharacterized membrane protein
MRQQEATTVISAPPAQVEHLLTDVSAWPAFLVGLESVERLGHERYRFHLAEGGDRRDVRVCVRHQPALHRFTWKALEGPAYHGSLELSAADDRHTLVRLSLTSHPGTLWAALSDMIMPGPSRAVHDLQKLDQLAAARR